MQFIGLELYNVFIPYLHTMLTSYLQFKIVIWGTKDSNLSRDKQVSKLYGWPKITKMHAVQLTDKKVKKPSTWMFNTKILKVGLDKIMICSLL